MRTVTLFVEEPERLTVMVAQGMRFGYPACCIGSFIMDIAHDRLATRERRKLDGTGYIPCAECNRKSEEELILTINKNRRGEKFVNNSRKSVYGKTS